MNPRETDRRRRILLSLQGALLGEVPPALRGVTVGWDERSIRIIAYFDGEISEEDRESMACVETEVIADFPEGEEIRLDSVRRDAPAAMETLNEWVYLRREPLLLSS
ncbi:MAG: hypothetical protein IRY99_13190 [Isosphaeraceae bacterium]|nr:hypothetical protein [Isosphaeraceae bacterium]